MNIELVIIESRIGSAIALKQALEQTGNFRVLPFADVFAALEYIEANPVRVTVIDLHMPEYPGVALIQAIRQKQPDILIYASTSDSTFATQATAMNVTGLLDGNYRARDVLRMLEQEMPELLTDRRISVEPPSRATPPDLLDDSMATDALFEKLAAEEPPRPDVKHGGTITNFMSRVSDAELNNLLTSLDIFDDPEMLMQDSVDDGADSDQTELDTPAQAILEGIHEETMPFEASPFETYLEKLRTGVHSVVDPEPDFLQDETFEDQDQLILTTQPSQAELERIEENRQQPDTVTIHGETPIEAPAPPPEAEEVPDVEQIEATDIAEPPTPPEDSAEAMQSVDQADDNMWDWGDDDVALPEDPRVAQMAIQLTRASLESTAIATLLIENGEMVASDGDLPEQDIEAILTVVMDSYDTIAEKSGRVRFIELPGNGNDALIYSRRTTDLNGIITMVFPGDATITDMRVQAKRLADALVAVPPEEMSVTVTAEDADEQAEDETSRGGLRLEIAAPVDVGPLTRYTFVWLPRQADFQIEHAVAEAINSGLRIQLGERGWQIEELEVEEDYVYLVAGIPGEEPPQSIARNLQKRSAKIASIQSNILNPDKLWAESYFALAPGRKLEYQEIQQYINFYRM